MSQQREKLKLTSEEGKRIIYSDNPDFEVIQDNVVDNNRWSVIHEIVIKRVSDGKFFIDTYSKGATESQDERPYDYSKPDFTEVFRVQKTVLAYE